MRKIKNFDIKSGIAIVSFSIIVTISFIIMLFNFSKASLNVKTIGTAQNIYTLSLDDKELESLFVNDNYILNSDKIIPISVYSQNYMESVIKQIIPYAIYFLLFLFIMSIILWILLKKIQNKNNLMLANELSNIENIENFKSNNPAIQQSILNIKKRFDDNMLDFKKLNSYLSHEQKNAISILRTKMELDNETKYIESLDSISESIDDLLTLSESKEEKVNSVVDIALICAEVCDNYKIIQNNITFHFDEEETTLIVAKERWIYRAVANLISNAIKYGKGLPIEVKVENKHHSVIVSVKDNGIGIPKEKQERIFNHRYRINELNKDGYGIGLSLVSHVCDLCGGFATVESEENKGSIFYLSFPENFFEE